MKRILISLLILILLAYPAGAILIETTDNHYQTVERTQTLTITITSDDGAATTHWILSGVDLGTNVLSQVLTFNTQGYQNLTIYQTNGAIQSNVLEYTIIVLPLMDTAPFTKLDDTLATNLTNSIENASVIESLTVTRDYYTNSMDLFFYVFVWGIYAGMLYIRQNNWHIPAILAVIMSTLILSQLPDAYRGIVQVGIIAGAFAVVYTMFKSKR